MVKTLVLAGLGINCEEEMAKAAQFAGGKPSIVHTNILLKNEIELEQYRLLLLPGGFSFGDDLGAGLALANRMTYSALLKERLHNFVKNGGCILGVCNGFQLLIKLGILPGGGKQTVSLAVNDSLKFENRWVYQRVYPSPCVFTRGLSRLFLPVRHGEGKFIPKDIKTHSRLLGNRQIVLRYCTGEYQPTDRYPFNPNGSFDNIAGITDATGRVFGLMAHPEAFFHFRQSPLWPGEKDLSRRLGRKIPREGDGSAIFKNVITYIKENL